MTWQVIAGAPAQAHAATMTSHEVTLPQGTIRYRELGEGPALVFIHAFMTSGAVWRELAPLLADRYRCIMPDWPLGAHEVALEPGADRSPPGLAKLIADFIAALDLRDVTLVGNDSGGALAQLVVTHHPERIGRLVLLPCDAFENFPPRMFRYLKALADRPRLMAALSRALAKAPILARSPLAFGWITKRRLDDDLLQSWLDPAARDAGVRHDAAGFIAGIHPRYTVQAARDLARFDRPVLLAWAREDRFFPLAHAERLRAILPDARLAVVDDARTFVALDQPRWLAEQLRAFVPA
jgi:pimeloyl-ACP methyl ester carboxylesterase